MNWLVILLMLAFTVPARPQVTRASLVALEKNFDGKVQKIADPFELLGFTQSVYVKGFGTVFTAQVNLIVSPNVNPFRQKMSKEEIAAVHARKVARLPLLRQYMREMLYTCAASLDSVPPNEQVVLAVSLFYYNWEDAAGLPSQIVMQAERGALLKRSGPDPIRVQEL